MNNELLAQADPEISAAINDELTRQRNTLELIASENIPSLPVIETMDQQIRRGLSRQALLRRLRQRRHHRDDRPQSRL